MRRVSSAVKLSRYLSIAARRLRRGRVGDPRLLADLLERAAGELMGREARKDAA